MREINFTRNGGLPFSQNVAAFMQGTYGMQFGALAGLLGDKVILSGVEPVSGNITAGWVTYGGMLIPFEAGLATANVDIITSTTDLLYEDGQTKQVYTTRVARCVNVGGFPFTDLKRLSTYRTLMDMLTPAGLISMWSGTTPPAGWALCDGGGSPARPDLRGRFIVGYDPADADYDSIGVGADLGRKMIGLTALQLPPHDHAYKDRYFAENNTSLAGATDTEAISGHNAGRGNTGGTDTDNNTYLVKNSITGSTGGGDPIENRPPYYTLAYIIKL